MGRQPIPELTALFAIVTLQLFIGFTTARTIDQIITSAYSPAASSNILSDSAEGAVLHELDMELTPEQDTAINGNHCEMNSTNSGSYQRQKRKALRALNKRWTNREIPYRIQSGVFSDKDITEIQKAMAQWSNYTCISFRRVTLFDYHSVYIQDGWGCTSSIGMIKKDQRLQLGRGCRHSGIILHEIGHAIGYVHEHVRTDRDDYVTIQTQNINQSYLNDFTKWNTDVIWPYGVPYDYTSVMHYGRKFYSVNGQDTIVTKDPAFQNVIGNAHRLSFKDIKLANIIYNCNEHCGSSLTCPDEGFLGKDCKCWCPGNPVSDCYPLCLPVCYYLRYIRGFSAFCNSADTTPLSRTCRENCGHCKVF